MADTGIQFAVFAFETNWALADERVFSEHALTTVETWLSSTIIFGFWEFVFAFASFEVEDEVLRAELFNTFAVIEADDVSFTFTEEDDGFWAFADAHDVEFAQWVGWGLWSFEDWEAWH